MLRSKVLELNLGKWKARVQNGIVTQQSHVRSVFEILLEVGVRLYKLSDFEVRPALSILYDQSRHHSKAIRVITPKSFAAMLIPQVQEAAPVAAGEAAAGAGVGAGVVVVAAAAVVVALHGFALPSP